MGGALAAALLAVKGAHGVGRALAQRLVGDGEQVLDVPAKLAARVRVLSVGHGRKLNHALYLMAMVQVRRPRVGLAHRCPQSATRLDRPR